MMMPMQWPATGRNYMMASPAAGGATASQRQVNTWTTASKMD